MYTIIIYTICIYILKCTIIFYNNIYIITNASFKYYTRHNFRTTKKRCPPPNCRYASLTLLLQDWGCKTLSSGEFEDTLGGPMEGGRIWPVQYRSRFQLSFVRPPLSLNRRRTSYVFRAVDFQKNRSRMSVPIINFLKEDFSTGDIVYDERKKFSISR